MKCLREFGLEVAESVEIFVWNSSAATRYMVLPERPAGTEQMNEAELAALVTRDAMIGVAQVQLDKRPRTQRLNVESPTWKVRLLCHAQVVSLFFTHRGKAKPLRWQSRCVSVAYIPGVISKAT